MQYKFDEWVERKGTNSAKFDEMDALYGPGLMHLGVADMDFKSPQPIRDAMQNVVEKGVFGYTVLPERYAGLVCEWMEKRYRLRTEPEWVVFSPRINMALNMAVETFTNPGEGIILHTPAYTALQDAVEKYRRRMIESPLVLENGVYRMDFDSLKVNMEKAADEGITVRMMLLCNPHNPTGRVWTQEELKQVAEFCRQYKLLLIADEIHADFIKKGKQFTSMLAWRDLLEDRIIVCNSITKTFNVPGVILSNMLIPDETIRNRMKQIIDRWGLHNPNIFAAGIMEAAYTQCDEWIEKVNEYIEGNYCFLETYLGRFMPAFEIIPSEGTYMAWIQTKKLGMTPRELEYFFIHEAKVSVYLGERYGSHTDSFIRINIAASRAYLEAALERIRGKYHLIAPDHKEKSGEQVL